MSATAPTTRKSDATATSGTMSAPVTGRISLDLRAGDGRNGTGGVEQIGAGSARCGMRAAGVTVGSPVHVAEGVGLGVGADVRLGVGVGVGVVTVFTHVHVGVGAGLLTHVLQLGIGMAMLIVVVAVLVVAVLVVAVLVVAVLVVAVLVVAVLPRLAASAIPPPHSPSTAAVSVTTTEAAINLTGSPVFPSPQTLCIPKEID
jgi:hypothetical protein